MSTVPSNGSRSKSKTRGRLFVFEGIDGSGKTTLSRALADHMKAAGLDCDWLSFPGREAGTLGRHVYELHHDQRRFGIKALHPVSLQLLHVAAHIDIIESRIRPALTEGRHIVLDRYWWSTFAYGRVAGASEQVLNAMIDVERLHWEQIQPNAVFLVTRNAGGETPSFEQALLAKEYDALATREVRQHPVFNIDNNGPLSDALARIIRLMHLLASFVQRKFQIHRRPVHL
jgi:dTMP kinase